jgi:hypothetical protein
MPVRHLERHRTEHIGWLRAAQGPLLLERLSQRQPAEDHDARRRRVHSPLPATRSAREGFQRIRYYGFLAHLPCPGIDTAPTRRAPRCLFASSARSKIAALGLVSAAPTYRFLPRSEEYPGQALRVIM